MPDSLTVTYRGVAMEDFLTSSTSAQVSANVLGVGSVNVTPFVLAVSDAAAAAAGVGLGAIYMNTSVTPNVLHARLS